MKAIVNGLLVTELGILSGRALLVEGGVIRAICDEVPGDIERVDAGGGYVAPGLVDVHCHGFMGLDASHGSVEALRRMSEKLPEWGTTAWLPTTMTLSAPDFRRCMEAIRLGRERSKDWPGARILGCHAEGPFINPARRGAQDERHIALPDLELVRPYADVIRLMTLAPELEGALPFIRQARQLGIAVSMGHTDATSAQALRGVEAGIDHATHTFNAMPPLSHRAPGPVGVALTDERVYCELIADTFHVDPMLFGLMARLKGDRLVLITDSIPVAGLPDGPHEQLGKVVVVEGIRCRFPDGTIAGSALTMDQAVRNMLAHTRLALHEVVNMASLYPARSIGEGERRGSLEAGKDADFIIADAGFHVLETYVGGRRVYSRQAKTNG